MSGWVELHGRGLHSGRRCSVRFDARPGPLLFRIGPDEATLDQLVVVRADQGVCLRARHGAREVDLCEHLLSALAGTNVQSGLTVTVLGPEVPLLDGGARELAHSIRTLGLRREPPRLSVARREVVVEGDSRYSFEPGETATVEVEVDFPGVVGRERGEHRVDDVERYLEAIAPARTFGFLSQASDLRARGRARHVDPAAVVALDEAGRALPPSAPLSPGEAARHKLLDLMGDVYLYGGPPLGRLSVIRPGHSTSHRVMQRALETGIVRKLQTRFGER
ncbi:MAG: UDP-3-O-acyl-N-acetylglucosamine deacetylase [Polyangiaceae bacterium]|nr:UDP-3-O-acyl-N-acetylglucosamine deacetylase [Polyangiaceae bacterium]